MIHSLSANQKTFHAVSFTSGLNVILAERSDTSTKKDTRNGLGKSTLIEIINFCLGARAIKDKGLIIEPLMSWSFTFEITLAGRRVKASRSVDDHKHIVIEGDTTGWRKQPELDEKTGKRIFKIEEWRDLLGWAMFNLPRTFAGLSYKPSFRSLVSYFVRHGADAYLEPFKHCRKQGTWDSRLHTAYLLGMNWEYASRWQELKDKEVYTKALKAAIKKGAVDEFVGSAGELETQRIQLDEQCALSKKALDSFKVHPQYESIQKEANTLTAEIHSLTNRNVSDRRTLDRYRESISEEKPPANMSLEQLYKESGLVFSKAIIRNLSEARKFHSTIISNRKEFLSSEIKRLQAVIDGRDSKIKNLTNQRAEIMEVLQTHGALQEITELQEQHVKLQGNLDRVRNCLDEMKKLNDSNRATKAKKAELVQTAEREHGERRDIWSFAVKRFNEHSEFLYESPGDLVIDITDTGYKYSVDIKGDGSNGIEKMKIFCFDLALLQFQRQQVHSGIDFLIHDTLMYDPVDARQQARALECAHEITSGIGGQYICTMNSDMVPKSDFSGAFKFADHVRLTLTDATPSGSLMGFRYEKPKK